MTETTSKEITVDNIKWVLWDSYTIENIDEFISDVINLDSINYFQRSSIFDDDEIVTEDIKDIVDYTRSLISLANIPTVTPEFTIHVPHSIQHIDFKMYIQFYDDNND